MAKRQGRTADWLQYNDNGSTTGPGYVTYSVVEHNNGRKERSAVSHITGDSGDDCVVNVTQNGRPLYVNFEGVQAPSGNPQDALYNVGNTAGNVSIHGKTNAKTLTFALGNNPTPDMVLTLDSSGYHQDENGTPQGSYIVNGNGPSGDPGEIGEWEFDMIVGYPANGDTTTKEATVVVTANGDSGVTPESATAYIVQAGGEGYVEICDTPTGTFGDEVSLTFNWDDDEDDGQNVYVQSNEQWEVSIN